MKAAKRIIISGTVQGVFFRQFIKDQADKLKIKGFVRNLDSGDVEVFMEGDPENIESLVEVCKKGSQHSRITKTEIKEEKIQDFKEFKIFKF